VQIIDKTGRMRRTSPLFLLLLAVASCSGKKSGADDALADVQGFCSEWGKRACSPNVLTSCLGTKDACIETQRTFCEGAIPNGKYSSLTAKTCLDAVEAAYSGPSLTADQRDLVTKLTGACSKIVSGSVGKDGACAADSDCNRDVDLACIRKAGSAKGVCEKPVAVANGSSCKAPDSVCGDGFYCDGSHCVSGGVDGDPCAPSTPCGPSSRCTGSGAGVSDAGAADAGPSNGTCTALKKAMQDCVADDDCETRICILIGSTGTGRCGDTIQLAPSEAVCATLR
jgi:hypothetical protein